MKPYLGVQGTYRRSTLWGWIARLAIAWLIVPWAVVAGLRLVTVATIPLLGLVTLASILLQWHASVQA